MPSGLAYNMQNEFWRYLLKQKSLIAFSGARLEKYTFRVNGQNDQFLFFLWDKLSILSPIDPKLGLEVYIYWNDGQIKIEWNISKDMENIPILDPKKWLTAASC